MPVTISPDATCMSGCRRLYFVDTAGKEERLALSGNAVMRRILMPWLVLTRVRVRGCAPHCLSALQHSLWLALSQRLGLRVNNTSDLLQSAAPAKWQQLLAQDDGAEAGDATAGQPAELDSSMVDADLAQLSVQPPGSCSVAAYENPDAAMAAPSEDVPDCHDSGEQHICAQLQHICDSATAQLAALVAIHVASKDLSMVAVNRLRASACVALANNVPGALLCAIFALQCVCVRVRVCVCILVKLHAEGSNQCTLICSLACTWRMARSVILAHRQGGAEACAIRCDPPASASAFAPAVAAPAFACKHVNDLFRTRSGPRKMWRCQSCGIYLAETEDCNNHSRMCNAGQSVAQKPPRKRRCPNGTGVLVFCCRLARQHSCML